MNLANMLSVLHLILLPFLLYFVWKGTPLFTLSAIAILLFSVLSDVMGKMAGRKKITASFLHPFADKIVVLALLFVFVLQGAFSGLIFSVFLLRDIIISYIRIVASRDDVVIRGELYGKSITALQFVLAFMILARNIFIPVEGSLRLVISIFTLIILVLGIVSIFHYGYVYLKGLRTRRELGRSIGKEPMVILANKKSGGYRDKYRRYLLGVFAKRRNAPIYYLSGKNLFSGVEKNIKDVENVIIAGGDGTFEAALNYKPLQDKNVGFFPLGSGNAFYSFFYRGKRFEYLRSRFKFKEVPLDVIEIEWNGRKRETLFLSVGVDAEVAGTIQKRNHSFTDYFSAGAKVAFGKKVGYDVICTVDGREYHWQNVINLILGKVPYIGFGMRSLLGAIKEDDGYILGMACVNTHAPFFNKALRLWAMFLTQMGLAKAPLIPLKGKEFVVKSKKPFPLQAGGDFIGRTKWVKVSVNRKQRVLMI
ncbi:MAG: diacylglycerol kinase family protein [Nanoarchaeota archaeon]|nr:diacylglycerol kinase family protein [Nanoarchaeota archaeon]